MGWRRCCGVEVGTGGHSEVECDNSRIKRDELGEKSEVFVKDEAKLVSSVGEVE